MILFFIRFDLTQVRLDFALVAQKMTISVRIAAIASSLHCRLDCEVAAVV